MSSSQRSVAFSAAMHRQITELAKKLGITWSAAVRMLVGRALGLGMARLLVDEKTLEVKSLLAVRVDKLLNDGLRVELHALVDEVAPPSVEPLVSERDFEPEPEEQGEAEEVEPEPEVVPVKGRPGKKQAAKARRR